MLLHKRILFLFIGILSFATVCFPQSKTNLQPPVGFDSANYSFNTPEELINAFLKGMAAYDPAGIKKYYLDETAGIYLLDRLKKYHEEMEGDKGEENESDSGGELELYKENAQQYITGTLNLNRHLERSGIDLKNAEVLSIDYSLFSPNGLQSFLVYANGTTVLLNFHKKLYKFELPRLVRLKGKWFIAASDFTWQNETMPVDKYLEK